MVTHQGMERYEAIIPSILDSCDFQYPTKNNGNHVAYKILDFSIKLYLKRPVSLLAEILWASPEMGPKGQKVTKALFHFLISQIMNQSSLDFDVKIFWSHYNI